MDPAIVEQISKFVIPGVIAAALACVAVLVFGKRPPQGEGVVEGGLALVTALAAAAIAGNAWANARLVPGMAATDWLGAMGVLGAVTGVARGDRLRGAPWMIIAALMLAVGGWLSVRSLHDWKEAGAGMKVVAPLGMVVVGLAVTLGLAKSAEVLKGRGGWPAATVGMGMAFAASQVIIIGCSVQNAAFTAAGIAAVFGVAGVAGLITRRVLTGPALLAAAGVALSGLVFFGFAQGAGTNGPMALYAGLLTAAAWAPVVAVKVLKERGHGWVGVLAAAVPAMAAVGAAVAISPPWGSGEE